MREHALPSRLSLQLSRGIPEQLFLDPQFPQKSLRIHRVLLLGVLGIYLCLSPDLGDLHIAELLPLGLGLCLGLLDHIVNAHGVGLGPGRDLRLQPLLVLKGIVEGMKVLRPLVKLLIPVRHQIRPHKGKQHQENNHAQSHHGHCILFQSPPRILPVGNTLPLLDKIFFLRLGSAFKIIGVKIIPAKHSLHIRLQGHRTPLHLLILRHDHSPPFVR